MILINNTNDINNMYYYTEEGNGKYIDYNNNNNKMNNIEALTAIIIPINITDDTNF